MKHKIRVAILFITFFVCIFFISAEDKKNIQIGINQIIPTENDEKYTIKYPRMKTYVSVRDKTDTPIPLLIKSNFTLSVDGKPLVSDFDVENYFYSQKEKGVAFLILMNAGGVMMGNPIEAEKNSVKLFIDQMREQDTISLFTYGEKITSIFEFMTKDEKLYDLIDAIEIEVGSAPKLLDHLTQVARQTQVKENKLERNVIILLSEGRDSGSMFTENKLYEFVDERSIPIYSIGISIPFNQLDRLDRMAQHTGGVYMLANKMNDMADLLKLLNKQVLESYVIEFKVTMKGDDDYHNLQVSISHKGDDALGTKIFYARKAAPTPWWLIFLIILIILILALGAGIFIVIIGRARQRKKAGTVHKKKCKDCGRIQKDDWNECLFCKYLPAKNK